MAILKSLIIRGASKRIGGMVLYSRAGETIARELAASVLNPRTRVQMEQRIKLGNVVAMYRANKSWMAGAFEDKRENESDYNAFVRMNLTNNLVALRKSDVASGAGVVAPYQVTSGSIPSIECTRETSGVVSNIYTGTLILTASTTVGQFSSAILSNNNIIEEGMQLSLIVNLQRRNTSMQVPYIVMRAYEVILKLDNSQLLSEYIPLELLAIRDSDGRPLAFNGETLGDGAACFILSQTKSGKTRVSSQTMVMYGSQAVYNLFISPLAVNAAIESYGTNADRFLESNEAKEASGVVISNIIQALSYNGAIYPSGSAIPINFEGDLYVVLYFTQSVAQPATISVIPAATGEPIIRQNVDWTDLNARAGFNFPQIPNVQVGDEISILVESLDETLDFEFTIAAVPQQTASADPDTRSKKK